jgi:hypothetical protein
VGSGEFEIYALNADELAGRVRRELLRNESVAYTQRQLFAIPASESKNRGREHHPNKCLCAFRISLRQLEYPYCVR